MWDNMGEGKRGERMWAGLLCDRTVGDGRRGERNMGGTKHELHDKGVASLSHYIGRDAIQTDASPFPPSTNETIACLTPLPI